MLLAKYEDVPDVIFKVFEPGLFLLRVGHADLLGFLLGMTINAAIYAVIIYGILSFFKSR